jgi:hypothetical protein
MANSKLRAEQTRLLNVLTAHTKTGGANRLKDDQAIATVQQLQALENQIAETANYFSLPYKPTKYEYDEPVKGTFLGINNKKAKYRITLPDGNVIGDEETMKERANAGKYVPPNVSSERGRVTTSTNSSVDPDKAAEGYYNP